MQNVQTAFSVVAISCNKYREDYKQKRVLQTDSYVWDVSSLSLSLCWLVSLVTWNTHHYTIHMYKCIFHWTKKSWTYKELCVRSRISQLVESGLGPPINIRIPFMTIGSRERLKNARMHMAHVHTCNNTSLNREKWDSQNSYVRVVSISGPLSIGRWTTRSLLSILSS